MSKYIIYPFIVGCGFCIYFLLWKFTTLSVVLLPSITFFAFLPIVLFFEYKYPFKEEWNYNLGDFKADVITTLIILPVLTGSIEKIELYMNDAFLRFSWAEHFSFWHQFWIVFFTSEFLFYWYHRYSHKQKTLLKYHSVHHGAGRMYWANSGRFHFMDIIIQFIIYFIPIYMFKASADVAALLLMITAVTGTMEHANIRYSTIFLSYFFNTGELHHLHHSPDIKVCNRNFGKVTIIFDLIFGTYMKSEETRENLKPGLPFNKKMPVDLMGQLKFPFVNSKK